MIQAAPECTAAEKADVVDSVKEAQSICRTSAATLSVNADCVSGRNYGIDESRVNADIQRVRSAAGGTPPTAAAPAANAAAGRAFEACADAATVAERRLESLTARAGSDNVLRMRGIIATLDATRAAYTPCLPDARARAKIDEAVALKAQTLTTCRRIASAPDTCERTPF